MSYDEPSEERWEADGEEGGGLPEFLLDPIGVARRRWIAIVACLGLGSVAAGVLWVTWKPVYRAESTILITSQQIPEDFVRSTVREDSIANINAMLGKVLSQQNLSRLIDHKNLFPELRSKVPRSELVSRMRSRIQAAPESGSGGAALVYGMSYESESPTEAAEVANALAALFVETSIERRNTQAQRTTDFLKKELKRNDKELRDQSKLVSDFRRDHRGELPDELDTNVHKLDMLSTRRDSLADQIAEKQNRILTLLAGQDADRKPSRDEVLLDEVRRQLARESAVNTDQHPNVIALRERVARLEKIVDASAARRREDKESDPAVAAERREIQLLQKQSSETEAEMARLNEHIDHTPKVSEQLAALERKEKVLRESYLDTMRKVEEAELAESLESAKQGGQVSILDRADVPTAPKRSRRVIVGSALAGSAVLALGFAVLMEFVDPVVLSKEQLGQLCDEPVLGSLPRIA